jgi:PII-like signaling protein
VTGELLKLTTYFGERDRAGGELLADELFSLYARERLELSAMVRGVEGFGIHHSTHTELLLTLSEDLPIVSIAVDSPERIRPLLPEVLDIKRRGLVTLERARRWLGSNQDLGEQCKLTVFLGRRQRLGGRPAYVATCEVLQQHGMLGATVLLGVDGTREGHRTRARLLGHNRDVPVLVVALGPGDAVAGAAGALDVALDSPLMTLERVQVCRRSGGPSAEPEPVAPVLEHDLVWGQKLTVHSTDEDRVDGQPLHRALVRRLRGERVAGATTLRGIWGFLDGQPARGETFWRTRRHAPLMTITVDTHERIAGIYGIIEEVTDQRGLVTVETVPVRILPGI